MLQGYKLSDLEEMLPYEKDIYYILQNNYVKELEARKNKK